LVLKSTAKGIVLTTKNTKKGIHFFFVFFAGNLLFRSSFTRALAFLFSILYLLFTAFVFFVGSLFIEPGSP